MQRPTLRQLEYFVALAARLSFREAAEDCYVSQPSLSGQIAQLEGLLGGRLFERDRRSVRLTALGERLLPGAREQLTLNERWMDLASACGAPLTGNLRLGVIPTVGPYLLPKVLPAVRAAFPELRLFLREDMTPRLIEQVEAGELDLLLLAVDVDLGGLHCQPLFSDPFLLAVAKRDPLAALDEANLADLSEREVLLLDEGHCLRDQTLPLCESVGGAEIPGFRASSLGTITQMVAAGLGVTFVPELAVEREVAASAELTTVAFGADGPQRSIGLAWRKSSSRSEEFTLFGEAIARAYARA